MLTRACLLIACAVLGTSCHQHPPLGSWNRSSEKFIWWAGEVTLPLGFTYRGDPSDSFAGHFTSPDGKPIIHHDIGGYAGAYAANQDAFFFEERVVDGARVWLAKKDWLKGASKGTTLGAVTFPDSGCANFFLESTKTEDASLLSSIAGSFRPNGRTDPGPLCH